MWKWMRHWHLIVTLCTFAEECEQLTEVNCSSDSFSGADVKELQCLLNDDDNLGGLELVSLVGHGESGFVWRGRRNSSSVIVKFRCCNVACEGGRVCRGESVVDEMRYECEAGHEAFRRLPDLVAACVDHPTKSKPFIVLKDVGSYWSADETLEDFVKADVQSNRRLLRELLRAVHAFLDPADGRALVHMDFTIANIMWDPTSLNLQLIDFSQVDFCISVVKARSGQRGHCLPRHFLKDLKKEMVHLMLLGDVLGSEHMHLCFQRVRKINFEKIQAQRLATDDFVIKSLPASCSSLISPWTWSVLQWLGHLDRRMSKLLATSEGLVPVSQIFEAKDEESPWSLHALSKLYTF